MARINFTAGRIDDLQYEPNATGTNSQTIHWDAKTPGLGLRITRGGARSYVFETRLHGRTVRLTIGDPRTWTLGKAQAEATRLKALIDQGIDPREQAAELAAKAEAQRQELKRTEIRVTEAWEEYIEDCREKWSARHLADHLKLAQRGGEQRLRGQGVIRAGVLAPLLDLKLAEITTDRLEQWLKAEARLRSTQAALGLRLFRAFLNWCDAKPAYRGLSEANIRTSRLARNILPKRAAKSDCLQREQLASWFTEIKAISNPTISSYLQILLLTGARREELANLQWEDVDFRWGRLTIRDKVEGRREIPLTPYVSDLLRGLERLNNTPPPDVRILRGKKIKVDLDDWVPSAWVFVSKTARSGRLQEPRIQHDAACQRAGIAGLTLHGLRRSFGTLSEWLECPAGIAAQIMGHKPSAIAEKHYRARPIDLLRMWHTRIERWMLDAAGIATPVPFNLTGRRTSIDVSPNRRDAGLVMPIRSQSRFNPLTGDQPTLSDPSAADPPPLFKASQSTI